MGGVFTENMGSWGDHARGFHGHCRHHYGSGIGNCICFCFCCLPLLLLASGAVGVYMMVDSFIDHRSAHIQDFNDAVDTWDATQGPVFNTGLTNMAVTGTTPYRPTGTEVYLAKTSSDSTPTSKDGSGCHEDKESPDSYTPVKWSVSATALFDASPYCNYNNGCQTGGIATLKVFTGPPTHFATSTLTIPLFKASVKSVSHQSDCTSGDFYEHGQCIEYSVLDELCVKVSQHTDGMWYADQSYGGYGCGDNSNWEPGTYKHFKVYPSGSHDFPGLLNIDVTVRSKYDPLVQFYNIVGAGASSFGMCQRTKFVVGVVLLSVFVLFCCILPIMVGRIACGWCGGKKYSSDKSYVHQQDYAPSYQENLVQPSSAPPTAPPPTAPSYNMQA